MRTCEVIGCRALILPYALFCDRCWPLIESDTRRIIEKHHRPNARRLNAVTMRAVEQATREILYFRTNGHPVPRDRPFEWDDAPPAPAEEQLPLLGQK